jgi:hypothetical protein
MSIPTVTVKNSVVRTASERQRKERMIVARMVPMSVTMGHAYPVKKITRNVDRHAVSRMKHAAKDNVVRVEAYVTRLLELVARPTK